MTQYGYALVGLTATIAMLVGVLTFAILRVVAGARDTSRSLRENSADTAILSAALQDAVNRLKAQEQATSARAAASDHLIGQITDSLTAGLIVVDERGQIQVLNPAGRRLLNLTSSHVGEYYLTALAMAPALAALIAEGLHVGAPIVRRSVEVPGAVMATPLGVTVSPLPGIDDRHGAICLFSDLTNVVELEQQLRLKETLARLGELTAGIAHEFRNGLATIHGYSRLIDPAALPAQYRPYVEGIRQEAEALGKVVTNFLNFARPDQVAFAAVDLEALVRRTADDLRHDLPANTAITVTGNFGRVDGDEVLLKQAIGNLLRNAAEACDLSGHQPQITVSGAIDAAHHLLRVSVDDNGPGIPDDARDRVFRPFFTTRSRGTGLGLSIVQKIVLTHNGRVVVGTSSTGGASIQLIFPLP
jgi:signal transduction histidine kinase